MTRKVLIFWEGFPVCGLLISELTRQPDLEVELYVTRPNVPFKNFFTNYDINPKIIAEDEIIDLDPADFDLIVITGWSHKNWMKFAKLARIKNVKTCVVVDNNLRFSIRQIVGSLYYRLFLRRHFTFAYCPGFLSKRLMFFLGMDISKVVNGNYGAHSTIYNFSCSKKKK